MSRSDHVLAGPLSLALPDEEQTSLLQACLLAGNPSRVAWATWLNRVADPIAFLKQENEGIKGMLPLLYSALRKNEISVDQTLQTVFRTAYANEEVRSDSYGEVCRNVLRAFQERETQVTAIRGADLAFAVYDTPIHRHSDNLELLIEEGDIATALAVAGSLGCRIPETPESSAWQTLRCQHRSGLNILFHRSLYAVAPRSAAGGTRERRQAVSIGQTPTQILSPEENLLYTCSRVYNPGERPSLRWVCDCWFLIHRYPELDWQLLLSTTTARRLSLPLWLSLDYLERNFNLTIPSGFLQRLAAEARKTSTTGCEFALEGARRSKRGGYKRLWRAASGLRDQLFIIKWMLLPTITYVRWADDIRHNWLLPLHYVIRPIRYIAHRLHKGGSIARR